MIKITNTGKAGRGLPKTSAGGKIIELGPGQSVEFSSADWDAIKDRVTIQANIKEGSLTVSSETAHLEPGLATVGFEYADPPSLEKLAEAKPKAKAKKETA